MAREEKNQESAASQKLRAESDFQSQKVLRVQET